MIAAEPRFIACRAAFPDARIVLFGIPFEGRVNLRRGADHGPRDLRVASDSIETYSPFLGRDLEDLAIADLGDCQLGDGTPREQLTRAREEIRGFWRPGLIPVMLGGGGSSTQGGSPGGDLFGGPLGKAVLGGVAAYAMKQMMDSR